MIRMRKATALFVLLHCFIFIYAELFLSFFLLKNHRPWKGLAKILCPWSPLVVTFPHYPTFHLSTGQIHLTFLIQQWIIFKARANLIVFTVQHLELLFWREWHWLSHSESINCPVAKVLLYPMRPKHISPVGEVIGMVMLVMVKLETSLWF